MQGCLIKGASAMFCSTEAQLISSLSLPAAGPAGKKAASTSKSSTHNDAYDVVVEIDA